jgi:hypothetical protein
MTDSAPLSRQSSRQLQPKFGSPERPMLPRNRSVKAFLPMTDEAIFSTRGQNLPILISHLSSSVSNKVTLSRRGSFFVGPDERDIEAGEPPARRSIEFERIRPGEATNRPSLLTSVTTDGISWSNGFESGNVRMEPGTQEERRMSDAAMALLNTPQIRSQRLIGHSNPRYRW